MGATDSKTKSLIVNTLQEKLLVKKNVFDAYNKSFENLKNAISSLAQELNKEIKDSSKDNLVEIVPGSSHLELQFGTEVIVFSFQNTIFEIDKGHSIWSHSYIQDNALNAFVGIIHVYNFLKDSYKNNQNEDLGYLIARIFINQENHYFVEGKRQLGFLYNDFSTNIVSVDDLKKIAQSAMLYCLDFEMLVPPYEDVSIISVEQIKMIINKAKFQSAKRMGFQFYKNDTSI